MNKDDGMTPARRRWAWIVTAFGLVAAPLIYFWVRPGTFGRVDVALAGAAMLIGLLVSLVLTPPAARNKVRGATLVLLALGACFLGLGLWDPPWMESSAANVFLTVGGTLLAAVGGVFAGSL